MPLTVINVAYPFAAVGEDATGGAEQVLSRIDEALVRAGHRSIVIAKKGSSCAGRLLELGEAEGGGELAKAKGEVVTEATKAAMHARVRAELARAARRFQADVIHMHGVDFYAYLPPPGPPLLVSLHLPPSFYPPEIVRIARPRSHFVCVSASQRASWPPCPSMLEEVPNGVRLSDFSPLNAAAGEAKEGYALALGRICPEKGFCISIEAAKKAGVPLILAGQVFPYEAHQRCFAETIAPALDAERRFIGPVGLAAKRRLLARARCLLVPSLVPETSSLVTMEALASGTPVIALRKGALGELIEHGKTGFLVETGDEMARAILDVGALRPEDCRRAAEARFSADAMTRRYLALYETLARPTSRAGEPVQRLSPIAS